MKAEDEYQISEEAMMEAEVEEEVLLAIEARQQAEEEDHLRMKSEE